MDNPDDTRPQWRRLAEMWSAQQAEHAYVPDYELIAFELPSAPGMVGPGEIGWEVYAGPALADQIATGDANSLQEAESRAETAWRKCFCGSGPR